MGKVKNYYHDEICRRGEDQGEPDSITYVLCPVCQGEQRGATPCRNCDGTFHVPERG